MRTTPKTKNKRAPAVKSDTFQTVDWFMANRSARIQTLHKQIAQHTTPFRSFVWPVGVDYFSPLNSIFLSDVKEISALNSQETWMARDGLIPLLWFFRAHPIPLDFNTRVLIHEDLAPFVPEPWRATMGTYRIQSLGAPKNLPRKLLVLGLTSDVYCSLPHLTKTLLQIQKVHNRASLLKSEKFCLLVEKTHAPGMDRKDAFLCEFMFKLNDCLGQGTPLRPLSWAQFEATPNFENFDVIELNEQMLYADSYLVHSALQKGARLMETENSGRSSEKGQFVRLSPYHGLFLRDYLPGSFMTDESGRTLQSVDYRLQYETAVRSEASLKLPWNDWLASWNPVSSRPAKESVDLAGN